MPFGHIPKNSSRPKSPLRTASTPSSILAPGCSSSSSANSVDCILLSVLSSSKSDDGDEVNLRFSDGSFTFPTWWLYLYRKKEGLPSPDEMFCKSPSKIFVHGVKVTGAGTKATVDITWNTGTTSQFPAVWLRVLGPTKALVQQRYDPRLPMPTGKNPRSGVEELTVVEKRMRDKYRAMLIDLMTQYMEEEWLIDMSESLLRQMVRYLDVEEAAVNALAADASQNDATADLSNKGSLIE